MNKGNPENMDDLVLGFEDLDPAEQARVRRFLQENPGQAARLQELQAAEEAACGEFPVDRGAWEEARLSAGEIEEQQNSLKRILAALEEHGLPETDSPQRDATPAKQGNLRRLTPRLAWALPLAAVLALVTILPMRRDVSDPALAPRVVVLVGENGTRGAAGQGTTLGILHTGQAFALDFYLDRDSHVVVYHLDPAGRLSVVWPARPGAGSSFLSGEQQHRLPRPEADQVWVLGPETGTETFLVTSFARWTPACLDVKPVAGLSRREAVMTDLQARLGELGGRVEVIEFDHRD